VDHKINVFVANDTIQIVFGVAYVHWQSNDIRQLKFLALQYLSITSNRGCKTEALQFCIYTNAVAVVDTYVAQTPAPHLLTSTKLELYIISLRHNDTVRSELEDGLADALHNNRPCPPRSRSARLSLIVSHTHTHTHTHTCP